MVVQVDYNQIQLAELDKQERRVIFEMRRINFGALLILIQDNKPVDIEKKVHIKLN